MILKITTFESPVADSLNFLVIVSCYPSQVFVSFVVVLPPLEGNFHEKTIAFVYPLASQE